MFGQDGPSAENSRPLRAAAGQRYQRLWIAYGTGNWILHKQTQNTGMGRHGLWDYIDSVRVRVTVSIAKMFPITILN